MGTAAAQDSALTGPPEKVPPDKALFCDGIHKGIINPPCTTPPRRIRSPEPKYPRKRGKVHLPGTVQLETVVGPDGLTSDISVSSSLTPEFDQAAIDAVKKWKFSPATKDGKPAATESR
jgi:TonB family protein